MDKWKDTSQDFDQADIAHLHVNGKFFEDRKGCDRDTGELELISEEFPEDEELDRKQTSDKFVGKLVAAWQKHGWITDWKGIYLVFNQEESPCNFLFPDLVFPVEISLSSGTRSLQLETLAPPKLNTHQCFIEFTD